MIADRDTNGKGGQWMVPLDASPGDMFLQHRAVFIDLDVPLATNEHERSVGAEITIPMNEFCVAPPWIVLAQSLVAHASKVSPKTDIGLVGRRAVEWTFIVDVVHELTVLNARKVFASSVTRGPALRLSTINY